MDQNTGKFVMGIGILILVVGLIIYLFYNRLSWIGNLPGDIKVEKENFRFYFPITTMILASVFISILIRIWYWLR